MLFQLRGCSAGQGRAGQGRALQAEQQTTTEARQQELLWLRHLRRFFSLAAAETARANKIAAFTLGDRGKIFCIANRGDVGSFVRKTHRNATICMAEVSALAPAESRHTFVLKRDSPTFWHKSSITIIPIVE